MPARETSPAESCTMRQPPWKSRKKQLDTASCGTGKVQLSQIIVINDRKLADLIWLMLMAVTTNASFLKLDWSLLCCCAPPEQLLRCPPQLRLKPACTCRAAVSPCFSILAAAPSRPSRPSTPGAAEGQTCSLCDSWLSTWLCQVFGEHSTLSVSFVSEKPSTVECTLILELPSEQPHVSVHTSEDTTLFHILYHIMCNNACFPNLCFFHTAIDIRTFIVFFWGRKKRVWQHDILTRLLNSLAVLNKTGSSTGFRGTV